MIWNLSRDGIVRDPTFSPDGTQIAFVDGYCDHDHSVWLMNADGSDAHKILVGEDVGLGAGHVSGLAWSAAGDQIELWCRKEAGIPSRPTARRPTGHWVRDLSLAWAAVLAATAASSSRDGSASTEGGI